MARKSEKEQQLELAFQEKHNALMFTEEVIRIAYKALAQRALTAIVIVVDAILFACVVAWPSWERLLAAVLFAVAGWFTVHYRHERKTDEERPVSS